MARVGGREYQALRATFRAKCAAEDAPCWMDGQPIAYDEPDGSTDDAFELDHYYPVSTHPHLEMDPANYRPSHRLCNRTRGNSAPAPPINNNSRNWNSPRPATKGTDHEEPERRDAPQPTSLRDHYPALRRLGRE